MRINRSYCLMTIVLYAIIVLITTGCQTQNGGDNNDLLITDNSLFFGVYEQNGNDSDGKEPIEWTVLESDGEKALIISRYGLDCIPYNTEGEETTWESSSLRKWLNETFFENAFSGDEQKKIIDTVVLSDINPEFETSGGNETLDRIFLLSITEAEKYYEDDESRICAATSYAVSLGATVWNDGGKERICWWWLRTPGQTTHEAAYVDGYGITDTPGSEVQTDTGTVRPAMWIDLKK